MPDQVDRSELSVRMMLLLGGGGALLVAVVLGLSLVLRGGGGGSPESSTPVSVAPASAVEVPQLTGLDAADATSLLTRRRLRVVAKIQVPSALHAGRVVRTYPAAGTLVPLNSGVTLYISPR
jgi:hypothetical protein